LNSNFKRTSDIRKTSAVFLVICLVGLLNPSFANETPISRGKKLFEKATCEGCHPGGENLLHPSKVLKGGEFAKRYKNDADIVKIVRSGVPNTGMPAFRKENLSDAELKDIIVYIRSLTVPPTPSSAHGSKNSNYHASKPLPLVKKQRL
jgi:mono/diheme cytochrome c family protein